MRTVRNILITSCLGLILSGCNKFLDHPPDNRASLTSPESVSQLLATAYPQANYMAFCESISDNVADKGIGGVDQTNTDLFFFRDVTYNQQDSPEFYWNACYAAIAAANQALEACLQAPDPENYTAQKGEALVARAYAHFMLVTFFSKAYDLSTADSDPGIPYVTKPENVVFKDYERKTVSYVYKMIEKDLTQGLPLINDKLYSVPRYHFTKVAANVFASRFYLFKKDYAKVVEHTNLVFPGNNITPLLRPWNTTYRTITYNELWARYAKTTEPANLLLAETSSLWARTYYRTRYGLNDSLSDVILGRNVTGGTWAFNYQLYEGGTNNYVLPKVNEYFVRISVNAEIGYPYVMVPLFTAEEALFNRAEANAQLNKITEAVDDLNAYASTRIANYNASSHTLTAYRIQNFYGASGTQAGVVACVLDFKRAEFVQEGMRWFDLLRHKLPVKHSVWKGESFTLEPDDKRRVFQIPESAKLSGLDLNPR
ncbi:RagB/SusD family nutrient uptake outer membrane protein [Pseudoflavitalea sp. X16]|uniref:RagB/SusD family nutrient uptake outer membrane protein n=1 Tax=Paraflavitalea devenefica TaxID=2716334 RepID=UPI001423A6BF|nr:RagB/SusD family nutrient uptake outer membrane protein [Paraflavitalea devenefica]NII27895.1 RagB/SusD family nutrient uptake outer membrane protein [Paraflavitalea devenefica]